MKSKAVRLDESQRSRKVGSLESPEGSEDDLVASLGGPFVRQPRDDQAGKRADRAQQATETEVAGHQDEASLERQCEHLGVRPASKSEIADIESLESRGVESWGEGAGEVLVDQERLH